MRDLGPINDAAPAFPLAGVALAPLRSPRGKSRERGFLAAVVRPECQRLPGKAGCAFDPNPGRPRLNQLDFAARPIAEIAMAFSLYAATVPSYRQILEAVSGLLHKAEAFCGEKGIAPQTSFRPGSPQTCCPSPIK
jgi:hypothetical protein